MSRKREPKERVARRVRALRKRQREELKRQDAYIRGLRSYFSARGMTSEWAIAFDVYKSIEVLSLELSFELFIMAIRGSKKDDIKPVKSIEVSTLIDPTGEQIFLVRPIHIPAPRRRK